jgi:site-specific recombinase XerC
LSCPKAGPRLLRPALTVAEAEMVLAQPDLADPVGVRDWAIPEVFYSTGIRRSELAHLAVTDIDHKRQTLLVRQGKGKKAGAADRGGVGGRGLRGQKRRRGLSPGNDLHGRSLTPCFCW